MACVGRVAAAEPGDAHVGLRETPESLRRDGRPEDPQEPSERDRYGRDGPGLDDDEQRPSIEEAHERAHALAQEHVLAARARIHGRELSIRERTEHRDDAGEDPREQE
jgi:hypothetical protein